MKKAFAVAINLVLAFGLMGCGTSGCDNEDIAEQALEILLGKSDISVKEELGARAVNIVMLNKEKNVCKADIWMRPIDEIAHEMNKDYVVEMAKKELLGFPFFAEMLTSVQALRLMGHNVKLRIGDGGFLEGMSIVTQDGTEFDTSFSSIGRGEALIKVAEWASIKKFLDGISNASMRYQVTSGDNGEYILAEFIESTDNQIYEGKTKSKVELVEIVQTKSEPTPKPQKNESIEPKQEAQSETKIPSPTPQESTASVEPSPTPSTQSSTQTSTSETAANAAQSAAQTAPSPANTPSSKTESLPSLKLATKDEYVNLRKAPSGEVLTPIYKKDFDKITIKRLDGGDAKWLKVLYFPPNVSDESKAITGYIHISQVAK